MIKKFSDKFHPEFNGWITTENGGVWISFIKSKEPGKGNFSRLIKELKAKYAWIKIPTPSQQMSMIAARKGFLPQTEWCEEVNETIEVLRWNKINPLIQVPIPKYYNF